jgi:hypothetical protein
MFVGTLVRGAFLSTGQDRGPVARAAGHAVLTSLIAASVSGTVFDLGLAFYAFAAAAAAGLGQGERAGGGSLAEPAHA